MNKPESKATCGAARGNFNTGLHERCSLEHYHNGAHLFVKGEQVMSKPESNEPECPVTVKELAEEIYDLGRYLKQQFSAEDLLDEPGGTPGTDCRLQLHDGFWSFHSGDSQYDQDHRGSWGAGFVPRGCTRAESVSIARDLIDEAMQDYEPEEGE